MSEIDFDIIVREPDDRKDYEFCSFEGKVLIPGRNQYSWYDFRPRKIYQKIYYHERKMEEQTFPEDLFIDGKFLFAFGLGHKAGIKVRLPWSKKAEADGDDWTLWEKENTLWKEEAWRVFQDRLHPPRKKAFGEFYVEYGGNLWKTNEHGFVWPYVKDGFRWFDLRDYKETIKKFKRSRKSTEELVIKNADHLLGVRQMPNGYLAAYPRWLEAVESYGITQVELVHTEVLMHKHAASLMLDAILDRY